jgi:biopolymer transport protein ExbD
MKYKARKAFGSPSDVDMTPMIDMTFQLIAFFMFTLSFAEADVNARIRLPSSELAKPPDAPMEKPLTLQLTDTGVVLYGGDEVQVEGMRTFLSREKEVMQRTNVDPKSATIIIRADGASKTGDVQKLIKVCQDTGFEKFVLRAKEEQKGF